MPRSSGLWMAKVSSSTAFIRWIMVTDRRCMVDHFNAVAEAILAAKTEIYITDWWLTPELVKEVIIATSRTNALMHLIIF